LFNLAVLISGSGTNLQAVIDAVENGNIPGAKLELVISNRPEAYGLERARRHGIKSMVIDKTDTQKLLDTLKEHQINGMVLAGYLSVLPPEVVNKYNNKIINIHPSLLPKFGGKGFYGIKVHQAVIDSGDTVSGATAHLVDCGIDTGTVLVQEKVPVLPEDTAESLQKRVLELEHVVLVQAVKIMCQGDGSPDTVSGEPSLWSMKILIIGSGGREHAIGWKLKQNPDVTLYFAPGNGGTGEIGENIDIKVDEIDKLADFAEKNKIDISIAGPELPLTLGVADEFNKRGLKIFGPGKEAAKLEGSKAFAKNFMQKYNIPTARYDTASTLAEGMEILKNSNYPVVIKADGLAAGKGVIICQNREDAEATLKDILISNIFGEAGNTVVIEEFLTGKEVSLLCLTDGETIIPMETASDYKRALNNDEGANTGGMGSISPSPYYTSGMADEIVNKTLEGIKKEGFDYRGVIYIGLILTPDGPKVLEYNARFGDPETEALLIRLESDLTEIIYATVSKKLSECKIRWSTKKAISVILTSEGYPGLYETGHEINIPETDSVVFHAGTVKENGIIKTSGGRVLAVSAQSDSFDESRKLIYNDISRIKFKGKTYRTDIGDLK